MADTVTLRYVKSGTTYSQAFNVLSVRGYDDADSIQLVPPYQAELVDGSARSYFKGFRRVITIDFGVVASSVDRRTLLEFWQSNTRSIVYLGNQVLAEEVYVSPEDVSGYENEWLWNTLLARRYILRVLENQIHTSFPVIFPPSDTMIGYTINHVKIEGTQASPELFTTNSDKLRYNYGTTPFPTMSLTNYIITVIANGAPYQDAKINQVGVTVQNGNNIDFSLAVSDGGSASDDGFYYADITFLMQAIV